MSPTSEGKLAVCSRRAAGALAVCTMIVTGCGSGGAQDLGSEHVAGNGPQSTHPRATQSTSASTTGQLQAIICPPGEAWTTITLSGEQSSVSFNPSGDCDRYPVGTIADNNPPVASLYTLSPDDRYSALWSDPVGQINANGGPSVGGQEAGYESAGTEDSDGSFVNASGSKPGSFSDSTVQDSQVLFNPGTGQLWWERDGHLFSNTVPPGNPVDHGVGYLYTFTPGGQPMPVPYYDSPSGRERAVITAGDGYGETFNYGPASSLSPSCLQLSGIRADGTGIGQAVCGGRASAAAAGCGFSGWIDDTSIVCASDTSTSGGNVLEAHTLTASGNLRAGTALIPSTNQNIDDALVTPDGHDVLFFTSDSYGTFLYEVPTDGSAASAAPAPLAHWADTGGGSIVGWILPNGSRQPW